MKSKEKKQSIFNRFGQYMGEKKYLIYIAFLMSSLSTISIMISLFYVWKSIGVILSKGQLFQFADISLYVSIVASLVIGGILLYFFALSCSHLAAFRVEVGIQKKSMEKIYSMPLGYFSEKNSGAIRKIINEGAEKTHVFLAHMFPDFAGVMISPLILFTIMFFVDWRMGLVSLIPIIISIIVMSSLMTRQGQDFMKQYNESQEEMGAEAVEYIRGIAVIKTFGQSVFSFKRFYQSIVKYKEYVTKYTLIWKHPMSIVMMLMQTTAFLLVPTVIWLMKGGDKAAIITNFIFFVIVAPSIVTFLMQGMYIRNYSEIAKLHLEKIEKALEFKEMELIEDEASFKAQKDIEFRNVSFRYEGALENAINNISFKIKEGENVALVGPSGSGKTTIARLAARFWDVSLGEILLGNKNIKSIEKEELMDNISFVFQNTKLFSMSIKDNIKIGKMDATDEEIDRAIELSQSKEIIESLPEKLDTIIGTKGTYLSGGESQRISLARCILKNAPVVILDEATAFADPENEDKIQKALQAIQKNKTTLFIAHRLTSTERVDRILVVNKGEIVQEGSHAELMKVEGLYKTMYEEYVKSLDWKVSSNKEEISYV